MGLQILTASLLPSFKVLLCSRSETIRVRILSLEILKYLVEHLREDYLALLPETIPFLAELLEDAELLVVKSRNNQDFGRVEWGKPISIFIIS